MIPAVSILIPTHNRAEILDRTLASLQQLEIPTVLADRIEIIVVNNVCTDRTDEVVNGWIPRSNLPLRLVHEPQIGLNNARNRAVRESRFTHPDAVMAFLDDDVLVDPRWLAALVEAFESTHASMIGGRVELWWEAVQRPDWMIPELEDHLSRLDHGDQVRQLHEPRIVGANFAFLRRVFDDSGPPGGFRPDLDRKGKSLLSGGETDFILKAFARGHTLYYAPDASLRHWVPPHRADLGHLLKIIEGKAVAQILMRERYGLADRLRSLAGGAAKLIVHAPGAVLGINPNAIRHKMRCAVGRGQIIGALRGMRTPSSP
ncbi:MAG: glycosyltransferase family 2 protein [Phycisphaerales bacterium]